MEVVLRVIGAGEVQVSWIAAVRAQSYRVTWTVAGAPAGEVVEVGSFNDTATLVSGLPGGSTVTFGVAASNRTGETQFAFQSVALP